MLGILTAVHIVCVLIVCINLVIDTLYIYRSIFAGEKLYYGYCTMLFLRFTLPFILVLKRLVCIKRCQKADELHEQADLEAKESMRTKHFKCGFVLYASMPLAYVTGVYRLFNFKNFSKEIGIGITFDFLLSLIPFMTLQVLNQ